MDYQMRISKLTHALLMENKMARKGVVILILAGIISSLGCQKGVTNSTSGGAMQDYFPLHVGNTWTYVYDEVGGQQREESYSIVETRKIEEYEYFVFDKCPRFFLSDLMISDDAIVRKTEYGDVVLRLGDQDILVYNFSDTILDSMRVIHADSIPGQPAGIDFITCLLSIEDTVVTPAGTFDHCYRFSLGTAQIIGVWIEVWFAPQVGPVRIMVYGEVGNTDMFLRSAAVNGRHYGAAGVNRGSWGEIKAQYKEGGL